MGSNTPRRLSDRFTRGAAVAVALALPGSFLATAQSSASAAPVPITATGSTSAELLDVNVLGGTFGPLGTLTAASVDVAPVTGSLEGGATRVRADASNLGAELLGQGVPPVLTTASQTAPPNNAAPTVADGGAIPNNPLLTAGISRSVAHAQFSDGSCLAAGTPMSSSSTTTLDATVLPAPEPLGALLEAPGEVQTQQEVRLGSTTGAGDAREVVATATSTLTTFDLFGSVNVGVSKQPTLTARANGRSGGAKVDYGQPVVTITPDGQPQIVLDGANDTATFALPENPLLTLELSLGTPTVTVAADGTSASGQADLLHLKLATSPLGPLPGADVARIDIVPLAAAARMTNSRKRLISASWGMNPIFAG